MHCLRTYWDTFVLVQSQILEKMNVFGVFLCFMFHFHISDIWTHAYNVPQNISAPDVRAKPCSVKSSFIFTREDARAGSVLMKLPTHHGEEWTLAESDAGGYLMLDKSPERHSYLVFTQSPDLEAISQSAGRRLESLPFVLECSVDGWIYTYKQELVIGDVNEHPPEFDLSRSYNISISESTSVGSNVFSLRHVASDPDVTGRIILYSLSPYDDPEADGRQCFRISDDGSHLVLLQPIDFDQMIRQGRTYFKLNLTATDTGKPGPLSSSIIMTVHVTDTDDQGPAFVYPNCLMIDNYCSLPYYQAVIKCDFKGLLRVYPGPVLAIDKDTQDHSISYSLTRVEPEKFFDKFKIEKDTGKIHVVKPSCAPNVDEFLITVTATENSPAKHSISTTLQIEVLDALVVPNMAWDVEPEDTEAKISITEETSSTSSSLPLTLFILSLIGFVAIGFVAVLVGIRVSRMRRTNRVKTSNTILNAYQDDCGDCQLCKSEASTTVTCFRGSCTNSAMPSPSCSTNSESLRSKMSPYGHQQSDGSDTSEPGSPGPETEELRTVFGSIGNTSPLPLEESITFRPQPSFPGQTDANRVYNNFSSFGRLGSMKHETKRATGENIRQIGRFKIRFPSVVPELLKPGKPRVRFDPAEPGHQSCV